MGFRRNMKFINDRSSISTFIYWRVFWKLAKSKCRRSDITDKLQYIVKLLCSWIGGCNTSSQVMQHHSNLWNTYFRFLSVYVMDIFIQLSIPIYDIDSQHDLSVLCPIHSGHSLQPLGDTGAATSSGLFRNGKCTVIRIRYTGYNVPSGKT